jgi:hypothetical protein
MTGGMIDKSLCNWNVLCVHTSGACLPEAVIHSSDNPSLSTKANVCRDSVRVFSIWQTEVARFYTGMAKADKLWVLMERPHSPNHVLYAIFREPANDEEVEDGILGVITANEGNGITSRDIDDLQEQIYRWSNRAIYFPTAAQHLNLHDRILRYYNQGDLALSEILETSPPLYPINTPATPGLELVHDNWLCRGELCEESPTA